MKKNETPKPKAPTPPVKKAKKPVIVPPTIEQNEDLEKELIQEEEVKLTETVDKGFEEIIGKDRGNGDGVLEQLDAMKKIAVYSTERLIGQAKGKILIVDEATEEDGQQLGANKHIEPKEIDLGLSQAVSDLMRFIGFLDMQKGEIKKRGNHGHGTKRK